jgi:hypothetical protein
VRQPEPLQPDRFLCSAPIAATAMAGSKLLPFTSSLLNPSPAVALVRMWAKASISQPSELAGSGEAEPVGKADRPHTQAFIVNLPRHAMAIALRPPLLVVEAQPNTDPGLGLGDAGIGVQ